ncbi:hypothetical protein V5O48_016344, partial [Marasmius crinis-equi]
MCLTPQSTALIHRDQSNPIAIITDTFCDSGLRGILESLLGLSFLPSSIPNSAIVATHNDESNITTYHPEITFCDKLWEKFRVLGRLVVFASIENLSPSSNERVGIIRDLLETEWFTSVLPGSPSFPHVSIACGVEENPFIPYSFSSPEGVLHHYQKINLLFLHYTQWIQSMVNRSIARGIRSRAHFGNAFGLTDREFLDRLNTGYFDIIETFGNNQMDVDPVPLEDAMEVDSGALILHPLVSTAVLSGLLQPYDPVVPGFNVDNYAPS